MLALNKQSSIELYLVKTFLNQVEIGRYLLTYQDGITITQKTISCKGLWPAIILLLRAKLKNISMPYESRMDQSHKYKTSKYEDLKKEMEKEEYTQIVKDVEIGARGFVAITLYQILRQIRIKGRNRVKCI